LRSVDTWNGSISLDKRERMDYIEHCSVWR
jgi:hypothetical protein